MSPEVPMANGEPIRTGSGLLSPLAKPCRQTLTLLQQSYQCLGVAALALASYFLISHFVVQSVKIVGMSMSPTLSDSDHYLLNRWVYLMRTPQRAEVVVLRDPADHGFSVKRIIASDGDSVVLHSGKVFVNGKRIEEPYLKPGTPTFPLSAREQFQCGKDQYFVLGDNRMNSADSRIYGPVGRQNILGMLVR